MIEDKTNAEPVTPREKTAAAVTTPRTYEELRLRVKEQGAQHAALARADRLAKARTARPHYARTHARDTFSAHEQERVQLAEAEAARAREEAESVRLENERLSRELASALHRAQTKSRTVKADAATLRERLGEQCEERVREERARWHPSGRALAAGTSCRWQVPPAQESPAGGRVRERRASGHWVVCAPRLRSGDADKRTH